MLSLCVCVPKSEQHTFCMVCNLGRRLISWQKNQEMFPPQFSQLLLCGNTKHEESPIENRMTDSGLFWGLCVARTFKTKYIYRLSEKCGRNCLQLKRWIDWVHALKEDLRERRRFWLFTAYRFTFCRISKSRPKLAPSAWVSSSSSCGSGTRFWLAGRWGSGGRRAPSAAAWWWTHSAWIHPRARPAGVWNRACASFWSECASGTTGHLEEWEEEGRVG